MANTCPATYWNNPSRDPEFEEFSLQKFYETLKGELESLELSTTADAVSGSLKAIKNTLARVNGSSEFHEEISECQRLLREVENADKTRWQLLSYLENLYFKVEDSLLKS